MGRRNSLLLAAMLVMLAVLCIGVLTSKASTDKPFPQGEPGKVPPPIPTSTAGSATPGVPTALPSSVLPYCDMPFTDVSFGDWYYYGVNYLYCDQIATGYNTTPPCVTGTPCFNPGGVVSRGQAAKVVAKIFLPRDPIADGFIDVLPGSPFYEPIGRLKSTGVATGYPDSTYRPDRPVSRAQFIKLASAAILVHTAPWWQVPIPTVSTFEDVQPGNPFYDQIETAAAHGVVHGYPCGGPSEPCGAGNKPYFRPGDPVNRAQASVIAVRLSPWAAPR